MSAYSNIIPAFDTASATKTLDVATSDFADAQSYAFTLQVYYSNYPSNVHSKNFIIDIVDYCAPTSVSVQPFDVATLSYTLGQTQVSSQLTAAWTTVPAVCNIELRMTMTPSTTGYIVFDDATS